MEVPSPSPLDVFAIGIREELRKPHPDGPHIGNAITSYSSTEFLSMPPGYPREHKSSQRGPTAAGVRFMRCGGASHLVIPHVICTRWNRQLWKSCHIFRSDSCSSYTYSIQSDLYSKVYRWI